MWNIVPKDFNTLMKSAVSIEDPELRVKFIIMSCVATWSEVKWMC